MYINIIQPWYNPFISFFASIAGGLVAGGMTYLGVKKTLRAHVEQEEHARQYELKRQAYFEYIDQVVRIRRILENTRFANQVDSKLDNKNRIDELEKWKPRFDAARIKAQVVASDKIKDVFDEWEYWAFGKDLNEFTKYTQKAVDAIRADLVL